MDIWKKKRILLCERITFDGLLKYVLSCQFICVTMMMTLTFAIVCQYLSRNNVSVLLNRINVSDTNTFWKSILTAHDIASHFKTIPWDFQVYSVKLSEMPKISSTPSEIVNEFLIQKSFTSFSPFHRTFKSFIIQPFCWQTVKCVKCCTVSNFAGIVFPLPFNSAIKLAKKRRWKKTSPEKNQLKIMVMTVYSDVSLILFLCNKFRCSLSVYRSIYFCVEPLSVCEWLRLMFQCSLDSCISVASKWANTKTFSTQK